MLQNKRMKLLLGLVVLVLCTVLGVPIFGVSQNSTGYVQQENDNKDPYWGESSSSEVEADSTVTAAESTAAGSEEVSESQTESVETASTETASTEAEAADGTEAASTETASTGAEAADGTETTSTESIVESLSSYTDPGFDGLTVEEDGVYTSKEEVALYLHSYGHLPDNYITKKEAQNLGWKSSKGNLPSVAPGKSIGGDRFGNKEGLLPDKEGRKFFECDIDYVKGTRNAKRIIFSNDGLIYYTEDHYQSFELLYGEE